MKVYSDIKHPCGLGSYSNLENCFKDVRGQDIKKFLRTQDSYTLHCPRRKRFERDYVFVTNIDDLWKLDLADVQKYSKSNEGVCFLFCVIDLLSKYAWIRCLKNKKAKTVMCAFRDILKTSKRSPVKWQFDKGREFLGNKFVKFLSEQNIGWFCNKNSEKTSCVVERFIRTLKEKIWRYFTHSNSSRFVDVISDINHSYNSSDHRSIGSAPCDVNEGNFMSAWNALYSDKLNLPEQAPKLKAKWSEEIFQIVNVLNRRPIMYEICDMDKEKIQGRFYEKELQQVALPPFYKVDKVLGKRESGSKADVSGYYDDVTRILKQLNDKFIGNYVFMMQNDKVTGAPNTDNVFVKLSPALASILGYVTWDDYSNETNISYLKPDSRRGLPNEVYVHCNITKPQIHGESYKNILSSSCINTSNNLYGSQLQLKISSLQYVPICVKEFDQIEIHLTDHKDSFLPFTSELDISLLPETQCSVESADYVYYKPISSLENNSPIKFLIPASGDEYIDVGDTFLHVVALIRKSDGTAFAAADTVGPVNNFLHSMFSDVCYPYRAYLETLFNYSETSKSGHQSLALWYKDKPSKMNDIAGANVGLKNRKVLTAESKPLAMFGKLNVDIFGQSKYLINNVNLSVGLTCSKSSFRLMGSAATEAIVQIMSAVMRVRRVKISPQILIAHSKN
ncbi:hypothetical protein B566_EDAN016896 [Ephemera danica]|nr:hypothetical protein B566_EDAN016896 [Ephemera danica]